MRTHHDQVGVLFSRYAQNLVIRLPHRECCLDGGGRTNNIAHGGRQALTAVSLESPAKIGKAQATV